MSPLRLLRDCGATPQSLSFLREQGPNALTKTQLLQFLQQPWLDVSAQVKFIILNLEFSDMPINHTTAIKPKTLEPDSLDLVLRAWDALVTDPPENSPPGRLGFISTPNNMIN